MCFLFHDWEKWSVPFSVQRRYFEDGYPVGTAFTVWMQDRACKKCGKYEKRDV